MAKKEEIALDDDFEEFDFNFDDEFGDMFSDAPPKQGREAITHSLKQAGRSFADEFKPNNINNIVGLLEKSIPSNISNEVSNLVGIKDSIAAEMEKIAPNLKSSTNRLISVAEGLMPKQGIMADALSKLKSYTEEDKFSRDTGPSKQEQLDTKVAEVVAATINENADKTRAEEQVKAVLQHRKDLNSLQIQNYMAAGIDKISNFNYDVTASFYRKSLELQFRGLDTNLEILSVSKVAADTLKNQLEAIVKNTALPDAVKLQSAEMIAMLSKNKMIEGGLSGLFGEGTRFDKMKRRVVSKAGGMARSLEESIANAAGMGEMFQSLQEQSAMMGGSGGISGSLLGDLIKSKLGEKLSNKLSATDTGDRLFSTVQNIINDPSNFAKSKLDQSRNSKNRDSKTEKIKRFIYKNIADLTDSRFDNNIVSMAKDNLDSSAIYSTRTDHSINKTIPNILQAILRETASIYKVLSQHTGIDTRADLMTYNPDTERLETTKETKEKMLKKIDESIAKGGTAYNTKRASNVMLQGVDERMLSPQERAKLEQAMIQYTMSGGTLSTEMYNDPKFLGLLGDRKLISKARRIKTKFDTTGTRQDRSGKNAEFMSSMNNAMTGVQNPIKFIEEYGKRGQYAQLEELGVISIDKDNGKITLNNDKYKSLIQESVFKENLKAHSGVDKKTKEYKKDRETEELLDVFNVKKNEITNKTNKYLKKIRRFMKGKESGRRAIALYNKIDSEMTGESLDRKLAALGEELTIQSAKKRVGQAGDFIKREGNYSSIKGRVKQGMTLAEEELANLQSADGYKNAFEILEDVKKEMTVESVKARASQAKEYIAKETTKEAMIEKEKAIRKFLKEDLTKENLAKVLNDTKSKVNESELKKEWETKLKNTEVYTKVEAVVSDAIDRARATGVEINNSELMEDIKWATKAASDAVEDTTIYKETREKLKEVNLGIAKDASISDKLKSANSFILNKLKGKQVHTVPLPDNFNANPFDGLGKEEQEERLTQEELAETNLTLVERLSELVDAVKQNKESLDENTEAKESAVTDNKTAFNDLNKDGTRDGSFREKISKFTRVGGQKKDTGINEASRSESKKEKGGGIMGILGSLFSPITGLMSMVGGVLSGLGLFSSGVWGLVRGIGSMISLTGGLIKPIIGLLTGALPALLKFGFSLTKGSLELGYKGLGKFWNFSKKTRGMERKVVGGMAKGLGSKILSKLPGIGLAATAYGVYDQLTGGNPIGALGSMLSGLVSQIPFIGIPASFGIDAMFGLDEEEKKEKELAESDDIIAQKELEASEREGLANSKQKIATDESNLSSQYTNQKKLLDDAMTGEADEGNPYAKTIPQEDDRGLTETEKKLNGMSKADFNKLTPSEKDDLRNKVKKEKEKAEIDKAKEKIAKEKAKDDNIKMYEEDKEQATRNILAKYGENELSKASIKFGPFDWDTAYTAPFKEFQQEHSSEINDELLRIQAERNFVKQEHTVIESIKDDKAKSEWIDNEKDRLSGKSVSAPEGASTAPAENEYASTSIADNNPYAEVSEPADDRSQEDKNRDAMREQFANRSREIEERLAKANGTQYAPKTPKKKFNVYEGLGDSGLKTTGGDITDRTASKGGNSNKEVKEIINDASSKVGIDNSLMQVMAAKESSFNPMAKAPTSSATGLYQFLNATWKDTVDDYGRKYGMSIGNSSRLDPEDSTLMAGEYLKNNLDYISSVKRSPNATDAYLTHFLGPGGAKKFLTASPATPSNYAVGDAAVRANPSIFTENGRVRSVGEVYEVIGQQLKKTANSYGISGISVPRLSSERSNDVMAMQKSTGNLGGLDTAGSDTTTSSSGGNSGSSYSGGTDMQDSNITAPADNRVISSEERAKELEAKINNNNAPIDTPTNYSSRNTEVNNASIGNTMQTTAIDNSESISIMSSIAASNNAIATNTKVTADTLMSILAIVSKSGGLKDTSGYPSTTGGNKPTDKPMGDIVSLKRGGTLLDTWEKNK